MSPILFVHICGGTFYLILTAWLTARRTDGTISKFDWVALLIPLVLGLIFWSSGIAKLRSPAPPIDGVPAAMNFFLGSVMLLAAAGDIRMLVRGGVAGSKRIARHLWRMCFGLFIATASFFLPTGRPLRLLSAIGLHQRVFQAVLRQDVLIFLAVSPLLFLIFWLLRVRFAKKLRFPIAAQFEIPTVASSRDPAFLSAGLGIWRESSGVPHARSFTPPENRRHSG